MMPWCIPWLTKWRSLAQEGHEIFVVHGGGRVFTATLKRMGIESKFVAGCASPIAKRAMSR